MTPRFVFCLIDNPNAQLPVQPGWSACLAHLLSCQTCPAMGQLIRRVAFFNVPLITRHAVE
jgi:hypothetical protein